MARWKKQTLNHVQAKLHDETNVSRGPSSGGPSTWESALVVDISMHHGPDVKGLNEEAGVGWIKFRRTKSDAKLATDNLQWAKPFESLTKFPLKGEMVMVTKGPSAPSKYKHDGQTIMCPYYYKGPINYNGHINNSSMDQLSEIDIEFSTQSQAADYEETSNSSPDTSQEVVAINKHGISFQEASGIYPLQPLEGDTLLVGRFGNSIRLSTSQPNPEGYVELDPTKGYLDNPWSDNENNVGEDPILIFRNGQSDESRDIPLSSDEALTPMFENLVDDKSSIWMTDGQTINSLRDMINDTSEEGPGVATTTQLKANGLGNVYNDYGKATPQIIIASDRLIFASKDDEILLFGKNGIGLAADNDIVIESNDTITISAPVIELAGEVKYGVGGGNAINGEKLVELLEDLCDEIMGLAVITATGPGTANPSPAIQAIKDKLADALSSGDDQA